MWWCLDGFNLVLFGILLVLDLKKLLARHIFDHANGRLLLLTLLFHYWPFLLLLLLIRLLLILSSTVQGALQASLGLHLGRQQ